MLQILPDKHLTHGLQKTRYFDVSLGGGRWVFVPLGHATGVKKQNKKTQTKTRQVCGDCRCHGQTLHKHMESKVR